MRFYSTNNKSSFVTLEEAIFKGLPEDNGLYMPESIPKLPQAFIRCLSNYTFREIAFYVCHHLLKNTISKSDLEKIIEETITFPAPLVELDDSTYVLELFHGPSLAFKDFGARFMAQLMGCFNVDKGKELVILVATSGDTGGAVAAGFYKTPGIRVVILYPSGKVSNLQEKQLTTLGHNIAAVEVDGTFDDCQALVKQAFLDEKLSSIIRLSSANSINISRLIPQSFYYFEAYKQLKDKEHKKVVFSVPSGNFGNLTAGLLAKRLGLPVYKFIAATNVNDIVPRYLETGIFSPRPSLPTLSNAMDVGNPSNFARIMDLYSSTWNNVKKDVVGYAFDDSETSNMMKQVFKEYNYTLDPHGAVGYLALSEFKKQHPYVTGIVLETAHPSKFLSGVEQILSCKIDVPERLSVLAEKEKQVIKMPVNFSVFKNWLLLNYTSG
jgi:threonine synthase